MTSRPTACTLILAFFSLWLGLQLAGPVMANITYFNVAWGEKPHGYCDYNQVHSCGSDCPSNYGWTWDQVCIF